MSLPATESLANGNSLHLPQNNSLMLFGFSSKLQVSTKIFKSSPGIKVMVLLKNIGDFDS
jgi:hypothetical protein